MRRWVLFACTALPFGACASAPDVSQPRTAMQILQRPLEPDLTTAAFAARTRRLAALLDLPQAEPHRAGAAVPAATRLWRREAARPADLPAATATLLRGETARAPRVTTQAGTLLRGVVHPDGDRSHHVAVAARLLNLDDAPLGEIGDRRHRTDPDDDRPEPDLLQRLRRRLGL